MRKEKDSSQIKYYLSKEWLTILLTLIFGVGYNVLAIFAPSFQGKLLDAVIDGKPLNFVILSAVAFLAMLIIVQVARCLKRFYVRKFANSTKRSMRAEMYNRAIAQPLWALDKLEVGDLMSRCIGDVDIAVEGMRKSMTEILDTGVAMIALGGMLFAYEPKSTAIGCGFVILSAVTAFLLTRVVTKYTKAYRESESKLTRKSLELTTNATLFREYGALGNQITQFDKSAKDTQRAATKSSLIVSATPPLYTIVASLGVVFVIYLGGKNVLSNVWTIGVFSAYLSLYLQFVGKASKISKLVNSIQQAKISWKRTKIYFDASSEKASQSETADGQYKSRNNQKENNNKQNNTEKNQNNIIETQCEIVQSELTIADTIATQTATLQVVNLTFAYDGEQVFRPITFSARAGEIVGLVGKIASGKSSALLAMTGLYGYIGEQKIDGIELRDISRKQAGKTISYSAHNAFLLDDTLAENIAIGRDVDVLTALDDVCFDKDLLDMPNGAQTVVGDNGVRLSGGQQARISLARALAGENKIVLLDDPFSAVDQATELAIIAKLRERYKDKIFVVASHRPTIFDYADKTIEIVSTLSKGGRNA
ncbi:MAG: ABC transporter ATP-binding protein [Clostridia bacterium]